MDLTRRAFTAGGLTAIAFGGIACQTRFLRSAPAGSEVFGYGPLRPDPAGLFDLPAGFSYQVISAAGETMNDGFVVPDKADGMGCFPLGGTRVALVRNHELQHDDGAMGPAAGRAELLEKLGEDVAFGRGTAGTALPGGTTTVVYDLASRRTEPVSQPCRHCAQLFGRAHALGHLAELRGDDAAGRRQGGGRP